MYKMMKVYDCQIGMPQDVKECLFNVVAPDRENDIYISHEIMPATFWDELEDGTEVLTSNDDHTILDAWLLENGSNIGEYVIINRWW